MIPTTDKLSVGEFIALYEQAVKETDQKAIREGRLPVWSRSDEVIFEFGRLVEKRVREGFEREEDRL